MLLTSFTDNSWRKTGIVSGQGWLWLKCLFHSNRAEQVSKETMYILSLARLGPQEPCDPVQGLWHSSHAESVKESKTAKRLGDLQKDWGLRLWQSQGVRVFLPILWRPLRPSLMAHCNSACLRLSLLLWGILPLLAKLSSTCAKQGEVKEAGATLLPGAKVLSP